jgi:hypothetical protein
MNKETLGHATPRHDTARHGTTRHDTTPHNPSLTIQAERASHHGNPHHTQTADTPHTGTPVLSGRDGGDGGRQVTAAGAHPQFAERRESKHRRLTGVRWFVVSCVCGWVVGFGNGSVCVLN